jgi:SHOCT-like protein
MNEHRREILEMLATGKITADEAERLIIALDKGQSLGAVAATAETGARPRPKYLRVLVESEDINVDGPVKVNVRVPMQLLRAGVRLASLIPAPARDHVNEAMREQGMVFDISQIKPENLEELIDQLKDLTVDVDQKKNKVRVFCE